MCNKRNSTTIDVRGKNIRLDNCIASLVNRLNVNMGLLTLGSCCGHGKYPMTIVAYHKQLHVNYDFISGRTIPRAKKFYLKDKDGLYYIPETIR